MKLTLKIVNDESPENPRKEWANFGKMIHWHRRLDIGDEQGTEDDVPKDAVLLPVYIYQHSGVMIQCTPFNCPLDSGQVGVIFATKDRIIEEFGDDSAESRKRASDILLSEVQTFNKFLAGDVWGWVIERCDERVESCWGYYGREECQQDGELALTIEQAKEDRLERESAMSECWP